MNFAALDDRDGIEIRDPIENARFELYTSSPVDPTPADADDFYFPVDSAVEIRTSAISYPKRSGFLVWDASGDLLFDGSSDVQRVSYGDYLIDISAAPMKLYFVVSGSMSFTENGAAFKFDEEQTVRVGARSFHENPAGTITVTDDASDVMRAMSFLGSALKTTTPERSWPTLQGHPPLVERGDEFDVPAGIEPPATETALVLPPEREYLYPAASLAYYLGATVEPGRAPRLVAGDFEYPLDGPEGYETTVERILEQVHFLDCITRTEGYYQVTLYEREAVEPRVALDFAALYDATPAERLERYLSVPSDCLESVMSPWHFSVDVVPTAENVEALPFLADDLAHVRIAQPPTGDAAATVEAPELYDGFFRDDIPSTFGGEPSDVGPVFELESSNTLERAWLGPGYPLHVNKLTLDSLHRRRVCDGPLDPESHGEFTIDIDVVCNDASMQDESGAEQYYGLRELPSFDVTVHHGTTTDELTELLEASGDFFHYIGHVTDDGICCTDGHLDVGTLQEVNVTAFLLNACSSYAQGTALVDRGSCGGIVTLSRVGNTVATSIGHALSRLLRSGFSLRSSLSVVHRHFLTGYRYVVIGDGALTLCQSESGVLFKLGVESASSDTFEITSLAYPGQFSKPGTMDQLTVTESSTYYLSPGPLPTIEISTQEMNDGLSRVAMPVEVGDELHWSDEITADEIADLLD